jgi:hypothetical protein
MPTEHRKQYVKEYNYRRRRKDREATRKREYEHHKDWVRRNPEKVKQYCLNYAKNHPEILRAQWKAKRKTQRQDHCETCGSVKFLERHHPDYSKPLEVITLCKSCHKSIHLQMNGKGGELENDRTKCARSLRPTLLPRSQRLRLLPAGKVCTQPRLGIEGVHYPRSNKRGIEK